VSYTLTIEPAAAAWRGPQRLVLQIARERIADVEYRSEATARPPASGRVGMLQEVARSCATCTHAHCLAFSQAVEALLRLDIPPRASYLRLAAAEIERASSHLATLTALFTSIGARRSAAALDELQSAAARALAGLAGEPGGQALIVPGGLRRDVGDAERGELRQQLLSLGRRLYQQADRLIDQRLLLARTVEVGVLTKDAATQFRLSGPLARASGLAADTRLDSPYAAYAALAPQLVTQESGDVYGRLVLLLLEAIESLKLADRALDSLTDGPLSSVMPTTLPRGQAGSTVEAPRGALRYTIESDGQRVAAFQAQPAPQLDRLLARTLLGRAALDDAVLIALSTDPCTDCLGATRTE
jgi:Ni,Fe-hydrogenase III large subunit